MTPLREIYHEGLQFDIRGGRRNIGLDNRCASIWAVTDLLRQHVRILSDAAVCGERIKGRCFESADLGRLNIFSALGHR